jgi:hypothetical protein
MKIQIIDGLQEINHIYEHSGNSSDGKQSKQLVKNGVVY